MKQRIVNIYNNMYSKDLRVLPANLAYSFTLAIIPILTLVIYFLSKLSFPEAAVKAFLENNIPAALANIITPIFTTSMNTSSFITIFAGIMVAANGCNAIIIASNTVFNFKNSPLYKRYTKSMFIMILIIVLFAFILIVPLFGKSIVNFLIKYFSFFEKNKNLVNVIYTILQLPVSLFIMFFLIKLIYIIAPDGKIRSKYVNVGAVFTTVSWLLSTVIFSFYLNHIARFDLVYGNIANIAILLIWLYVISFVFVVGICINKEYVDIGIEKTNNYKFEEIRNRIKQDKRSSNR